MRINNREKTEWLNTWISGANNSHKRILLIGDSVTRRLRGEMERFTNGEYQVDLFAASYSVEDERLLQSFRDFLNKGEYEYDIIVLNYGFHHGFSLETHLDENQYALMKKNIDLLIAECKNISTHIFLMNGSDYCIKDRDIVGNHDYVAEIASRNDIYDAIASQEDIPLINMCEFVNSMSYYLDYEDEVHFDKASTVAIAYMVFRRIYEECGMWNDKIAEKSSGILKEYCNSKTISAVLNIDIRRKKSLFRVVRRFISKCIVFLIVINRRLIQE